MEVPTGNWGGALAAVPLPGSVTAGLTIGAASRALDAAAAH